MSKFNKLVELAKNSVEKHIVQYNEGSGLVFLPTTANDLILELGSDWYCDKLSKARYRESTINRKVENMDFDKLANALDDWYKTELYPKLYNKFKSEGKEILYC